MLPVTTENFKPAYSVAEVSAMTSLSKSFLRNEIRARNLRAKAVGRRVLILNDDLKNYLDSKDDWHPSSEKPEIN